MALTNKKKLEVKILVLLLVGVYVVLRNITQVNFRLLEPARYVTLILIVAFFLRALLHAFFFDKKEFQEEKTYMDAVNISLIPGLVINNTEKMLTKKVNFRNGLILVFLQILLTLFIVFYFNAFPTSSAFVLITLVYCTAAYFFYLRYRESTSEKKKMLLTFFALLGGLVVFPAISIYGWGHLLSVLVAFYVFWVSLLGLFADRRYVYSLAIILITSLPFFLIIEQANPDITARSEFIAFAAYLLLLLGVFKDLFYDFLFTE